MNRIATPRLRLLAFAGLLFALACVSRGSLLSEEHLGQIQPGLTTQTQVREWFGYPDAAQVDAFGAARWGYTRELRWSERRIDKWLLGPVSYVLDRTILFPPRARPPEAHLRDQLEISFGPDGLVTSFAHHRSSPRQ